VPLMRTVRTAWRAVKQTAVTRHWTTARATSRLAARVNNRLVANATTQAKPALAKTSVGFLFNPKPT
jgi:hypothetical protein